MPEKDIKQKVEDLGVLFEQFGKPPMIGRVFAYLLLSEPPYRSFDEITTFLEASKSAISNALNSLQNEGSVSYITFSGDRKRYFKIDTHNWLKQLMAGANNLSKFNILLEDTLNFRKDKSYQEFNNELKNILDFQVYLSKVITEAIGKWNNK